MYAVFLYFASVRFQVSQMNAEGVKESKCNSSSRIFIDTSCLCQKEWSFNEHLQEEVEEEVKRWEGRKDEGCNGWAWRRPWPGSNLPHVTGEGINHWRRSEKNTAELIIDTCVLVPPLHRSPITFGAARNYWFGNWVIGCRKRLWTQDKMNMTVILSGDVTHSHVKEEG